MSEKIDDKESFNSRYVIDQSENKYGFLRAQFARSILKNNEMNFYSSDTVTHYTDINGLYGIIESGGFWLSDHRFLNDTMEFEDGRKLTINILKKLNESDEYDSFKEILLHTINELEKHKEPPYFVCSFSKKNDCLEQWRAYGDNGYGISITFNNKIEQSLSHLSVLPILTIGEVIYDDNEKEKLIRSKIKAFFEEYNIDCLENKYLMRYRIWGEEMSASLALDFIKFKHKSYAYEQEIRMAVPKSYLNHFSGIRHRVIKGRIIPYITSEDIYDDKFKKHIGTDKMPIKEIRVGPVLNQDITIRSIEQYLNNKGYTDVKVIKSDIPYRG